MEEEKKRYLDTIWCNGMIDPQQCQPLPLVDPDP